MFNISLKVEDVAFQKSSSRANESLFKLSENKKRVYKKFRCKILALLELKITPSMSYEWQIIS